MLTLKNFCVAGVALSLACVGLSAGALTLPKPGNTPLVLQAQGAFYVGGEKASQTFEEMGSQRPADTATVNQMYVEYMVPHVKAKKTPVILMHGAGQSGAVWNWTPDGRMGWFEYFVRKDYPTYVIDQVGRARSGFNQAIFNRVGAGQTPSKDQPKMVRPGDKYALWINMRVGPEWGKTYADTKFPSKYFDELSKVGIPDLTSAVPTPNPTLKNTSDLAKALGGAIVVGHSQSGAFPMDIALIDPKTVKAMVMLEPGSCKNDQFSDADIAKIKNIPLMVMYGDHLEASTGLPGNAGNWIPRLKGCQAFVDRVNRAGGKAVMRYLPDLGIRGNSHMLMHDTNSHEIADMVIDWLEGK